MVAAIVGIKDVELVVYLREPVHQLEAVEVREDPVDPAQGDVAISRDRPVGVLGAHQFHKGVHELFNQAGERRLGIQDASSIKPKPSFRAVTLKSPKTKTMSGCSWGTTRSTCPSSCRA